MHGVAWRALEGRRFGGAKISARHCLRLLSSGERAGFEPFRALGFAYDLEIPVPESGLLSLRRGSNPARNETTDNSNKLAARRFSPHQVGPHLHSGA
jgi:hypothetical protein